jgi:hypothetical protein
VGLRLVGFDPFLDRHDIAAGEDWESRLERLIQSADTIVFVVTPQAIKSSRCSWEIKRAGELSKRIIPIVVTAVPDAEVPAALRRLNYIFFNGEHTFARALVQLGDALNSDLDWIREHTRLAELAVRWKDRNQIEALLLRGAELEVANTWMAGWKPGAPEVTDLQRTFVQASMDWEAARSNEERRKLDEMASIQAARATALVEREAAVKTLSRRTTAGLLASGTLTAVASGLAYWGNDAEARFKRERQRAEDADRKSAEEAIRQQAARTDIEGQLAAYAASPGQQAADGPPGGNSPYTKTVLMELAKPAASIQQALANAHYQVLKSSEIGQRPYLSTDMNGEIFLLHKTPGRRLKALVVSVDSLGKDETLTVQARLENVARDAAAWNTFLSAQGFEVNHLTNPGFDQLKAAMAGTAFPATSKQGLRGKSLVRKAGIKVDDSSSLQGALAERPNTLLAFFFAGAGLYHNGSNYVFVNDSHADMTPGKAELSMPTFVKVDKIQAWAREIAQASIIILDTNFNDVSSMKKIDRPEDADKSIWDPPGQKASASSR